MEEGDTSDGSTSSVSEDIPTEDIASPDIVENTDVPASSEVLVGEDERSQTPLQDEVLGANGQVAEISGSVNEVNTSPKLHQTSQLDATNDDNSERSDNDEGLKQTMRDDHEELDYDEEVQPEGCPVVTASATSPSHTHQKAADKEEKENVEDEKVDNCFCCLYNLIKAQIKSVNNWLLYNSISMQLYEFIGPSNAANSLVTKDVNVGLFLDLSSNHYNQLMIIKVRFCTHRLW